MEITVEQGLGYVTVEQREKEKMEIGTISLDSSFSPILNVGFDVSNVRVGKMTNYEKLTFDILTDGTITAEDAIAKASTVLAHHFNLWAEVKTTDEKVVEEVDASEEEVEDEEDKK